MGRESKRKKRAPVAMETYSTKTQNKQRERNTCTRANHVNTQKKKKESSRTNKMIKTPVSAT